MQAQTTHTVSIATSVSGLEIYIVALNPQNLDPRVSMKPILLYHRLFIILAFMNLYFSVILSYVSKLPYGQTVSEAGFAIVVITRLRNHKPLLHKSMCVYMCVYNAWCYCAAC